MLQKTGISEEQVLHALRAVKDPDLGRDIVSLGFVKTVELDGGEVRCVIELTTPACPVKDQLKEEARAAIAAVPGVKKVSIEMTSQVRSHAAPARERLIPKVKNVIAVASGKGGVGKSTVSANLALVLAQSGAKVGLMDADVYGPSIPTLLGTSDKPLSVEGRILPVERYGVKVISMGFFIAQNEAVIWRGPMLHKMVQDFLGVVEWGELDYLLVDLPPGTGDIQLSLCQTIPLSGAVVVSTPQDVAWNVAQKAIVMFDKLNTPILGVIENMSHYECSHCGERDEIFGHGGARRAAERLGLAFLGEIPLTTSVRETSDQGDPIVRSKPDSTAAKALRKIGENLAAQISIRNISGETRRMPKNILRPSPAELELEWTDGGKDRFAARKLRAACPCASCVNEITSERVIRESDIAKDLQILSVSPVGRYALQIVFSDGHGTGLYGYEYLSKISEK